MIYAHTGSFINPELQGEIDILIMHSERRQTLKKESFLSNCIKPEVYRPTLIIIGFFAFQQLSGIFVVVVYAAKFATEVGVTMDPFLCVVYIGIVRVVAGTIIGLLLDHLGRRTPTIYSSILMALCMYGLVACKFIQPSEDYQWIPTLLILCYVFTSTLGLLTVSVAVLVWNSNLFPSFFFAQISFNLFFTFWEKKTPFSVTYSDLFSLSHSFRFHL